MLFVKKTLKTLMCYLFPPLESSLLSNATLLDLDDLTAIGDEVEEGCPIELLRSLVTDPLPSRPSFNFKHFLKRVTNQNNSTLTGAGIDFNA